MLQTLTGTVLLEAQARNTQHPVVAISADDLAALLCNTSQVGSHADEPCTAFGHQRSESNRKLPKVCFAAIVSGL